MRVPLRVIASAAVVAALASVAPAAPLGTGFLYQGELLQNGVPVDGTAHLRFSLWNAAGTGSPPVGGARLGSDHLLPDVSVTDGVFAVMLNEAGQFGTSAFDGEARWIQVEVCDDAGCTSWTTLSPRQPVTATPYALRAAKPWETWGANVVYPNGNVGIGIYGPPSRLSVAALYHGDGIRLAGSAVAAPGYGLFDNQVDRGGLGLATVAGLWGTDALSGDIVLRALTGRLLLQTGFLGSSLAINSGNVGLGTTAPGAKLDVRGNVKLGATGQYWAPGAEENLRIVRGQVEGDGSSTLGCCFSVVRGSTGYYDVTFAAPFAGPPIVTATPRSSGVTATIIPLSSSMVRLGFHFEGTPSNTAFHFIAMGPR